MSFQIRHVSGSRIPAAPINQQIYAGPPVRRGTYWDSWLGRYLRILLFEVADGDMIESVLVRPQNDREFPCALINQQILVGPPATRGTYWGEFGMYRPPLRITYIGGGGAAFTIDVEGHIGFGDEGGGGPPGGSGVHRVIY